MGLILYGCPDRLELSCHRTWMPKFPLSLLGSQDSQNGEAGIPVHSNPLNVCLLLPGNGYIDSWSQGLASRVWVWLQTKQFAKKEPPLSFCVSQDPVWPLLGIKVSIWSEGLATELCIWWLGMCPGPQSFHLLSSAKAFPPPSVCCGFQDRNDL